MKRKNYNWLFYILILAFIGGFFYLGFTNVEPEVTHTEKTIRVFED